MKVSDIKKVACLGGGIIGSSWAIQFAMHGMEVVIRDINDEQLQKSEAQMRKSLDTLVAANAITEARKGEILSAVRLTTSVEDAVKDVQLVQENGPERLEIKQSILAQARDRASMGADTQADVTQAESRLQRAHSALAEAEDALRVAYATYSRLTGIYTVGKLDAVPMPAEMPDTAAAFIQMAEKHNPKLAAYLQDIRAAKGEKELAQSAMYPTFQLEAGPEYSDRGGDRDRWVYSFDVLATVRWNVFNSGADVEGIRAASAREREARQNLYDYMDTLRLDMESTWSNYQAAKEQYKHYSDAVVNNTYTRQAYHDQFLLGNRSLLDVLDSENELYNSASQAETARGNILVGAYRLCALSGDLLPRMSVPEELVTGGPGEAKPVKGEDFDLGWFR